MTDTQSAMFIAGIVFTILGIGLLLIPPSDFIWWISDNPLKWFGICAIIATSPWWLGMLILEYF